MPNEAVTTMVETSALLDAGVALTLVWVTCAIAVLWVGASMLRQSLRDRNRAWRR